MLQNQILRLRIVPNFCYVSQACINIRKKHTRSKTRSRRTVNRTFSVMKATRSPAGWALRAVRWNENAVFPRPLFERGWFRRFDGVLCSNCFEDLALNCLSLNSSTRSQECLPSPSYFLFSVNVLFYVGIPFGCSVFNSSRA